MLIDHTFEHIKCASNVFQMCFKCVQMFLTHIWNVLVSNVCQKHLNTFEKHLKHIWGTLNVYWRTFKHITKHLNTLQSIRPPCFQNAQNTFEHIWNTFETHLKHIWITNTFQHIGAHWGTLGHKTHLNTLGISNVPKCV